MNAGFFKRSFTSLIDILFILVFVSASFYLFGRSVLRDNIPNFNEIYSAYNEVTDAYQLDYNSITDEYNAQIELANEDDTLVAEATALYQTRISIINAQNLIDIEPYNRPLTRYFLNNVYFYAIGFLLLTSIYTVVTNGKTIGRRLMKVQLEGSVNPISVFFHDVIAKYFFILLVFMVNAYFGLLLLGVSLLADILLMALRKDKATLRDLLFRIKVINSSYWK